MKTTALAMTFSYLCGIHKKEYKYVLLLLLLFSLQNRIYFGKGGKGAPDIMAREGSKEEKVLRKQTMETVAMVSVIHHLRRVTQRTKIKSDSQFAALAVTGSRAKGHQKCELGNFLFPL